MSSEQAAAERFLAASREFARRVGELGLGDTEGYYWYHTVELPHGLVTPGLYDFRSTLSRFPFPDQMDGLRVLDVGSATGFFAFEFEKRGARVVSVELPSLGDLDRFPGQSVAQSLEKIEQMIVPWRVAGREGLIRNYSADELYFFLLEGPFQFCKKLLGSHVERCYSTIYDLSSAKLGADGFDLVFVGDVLLHTLNPLAALTAAASLCRGELVLAQVIPEPEDGVPAMQYVGGDSPLSDEVSWWLPNKLCLVQLLRKLGFREVIEAGHHQGVLRSSGFAFDRTILRARR